MSIKDKLIDELKTFFKSSEMKNEFVELMKPLIQLLLQEIYPYIFLCFVLVIISFLMIVSIFVILLHHKLYNRTLVANTS